MEGKHSTLHLFTPIMERSSMSFSPRGQTPSSKAPSPMDLTCSSREEERKRHSLALKDFKETFLPLDKPSDFHGLSKLLSLRRKCQVNMGNQQAKIQQNLKDEFFGSGRRKKRGESRISKSSFKVKMASGNPLKSRNQRQLKTKNYSEEDISTNRACIGGDFERDQAPNPAIDFLYFPKCPLSNINLNEENADSDHSDYDNQTIYEVKSGQDSQRIAEASLRRFEEVQKETDAHIILAKIEEVEGIIRRVRLTSSDLVKDNGRFMSLKTSFENDHKDMEFSATKPLVTKELRSLGEALGQCLERALKVEEGNLLKQNYKHAKVPRGPRCLPLNPSYSEANSRSTSPTVSPLLSSNRPNPEPQSEVEVTGRTWGSSVEADMGDYSNTNEQWMDWMREYGSVYTDANNSEDGLLCSDEALRRQEEVWQQEVEENLVLSRPGRPQHVDFLHLTALEEEDISLATSPSSPPPPLSRELGGDTAMEEPTPILTFFRQFPEVLNADIIEESPYWGDGKKSDLFPVILPYPEKITKYNWPLKPDELLEKEKDVDEAEVCSVEELTNALNESDSNGGKGQIVQVQCRDTETDCVEDGDDAMREVAPRDENSNFINQRDGVILQWEEKHELEMREVCEPSFEEEGIQNASQDLATQPPKSPVFHIQSFSSEPPPGSTMTRATFSPSASPTDKQPQLPALFSGLRVLRKGVVGPDHDTVSQFKPIPQGGKSQGTFLDQISQLLNREKHEEEGAEEQWRQNELSDSLKKEEGAVVENSRSSADAVFDAFKAFFTPKPLKRDPSEKVDLDAVRKKIRNERDLLKTEEEVSDGKADSPTDAEDRTPGRLQAVWPPLQEEEKVGLKYTEAEHQAALLQLKRECQKDLEKIQEDYVEQLSKLREESYDSVARLQFTIIELQSRLSQSEYRRQGEARDASVATEDDSPHKTFRNVCIQTDQETFVKSCGSEDGGFRQQTVEPKKLDIDSISINLSDLKDDGEFQSHIGLTEPISAPPPPPVPPPPPPLPLSGPGSGLLPPPPPLPGRCGVTSIEKAPRKSAVEPSRPMKPLYWTRIQIQESNKETLWDTLEEPNINTCDFEDLFAKTTTQMKRKPLSETYGHKAKTRKIVKLLDGKRSQAVGILISSLHLDMKDIQHAVLTVDNSVVDLDTIEALYENRAQPDELERIEKHYETSNEEEIKLLDKPEQFLFELSQIPDFAGRASCIIFQSAFLDGIASLQRKLRVVSSVCEVLLESASVKEIMGLVLALGNHMNGGSRTRGQADGFGLEILPRLKDVKSRDNRINLGDYMVSYYLHNVDKNAGTDKSVFPLPEPQDLFLAAQVKFEELHRDLTQLSRDLTQCEKDIQKVCSNSPEERLQPFKDKMEAFVLSARKEHGEASYQLKTVEKSFQGLVAYFGLRPKAGDKEVTTCYLFMLWFEFCADFKNRWKRESKNISKERLKEAQLSVKRITAEKKVETRKINANSLKQRLRQKEAHAPVFDLKTSGLKVSND